MELQRVGWVSGEPVMVVPIGGDIAIRVGDHTVTVTMVDGGVAFTRPGDGKTLKCVAVAVVGADDVTCSYPRPNKAEEDGE